MVPGSRSGHPQYLIQQPSNSMRSLITFLPALLAAYTLTSCGPAAWNQNAEYLPAPLRTAESLESATIQDYVADLPPAKALEPDTQTLRSKVNAAPVERTKDRSRLTLMSSQGAPERKFLLNHRSKTLRMTVSKPNSTDSPEVHVFQRQSSDWYHWIED